MISALSSLIEFFAAVYVTMSIKSDFCERFWTPQYYKDLDSLLGKYNFYTSSTSKAELIKSVKHTYDKIQGYASRKGTMMLFFCIIALIYIGFEDPSSPLELAINHYKPLFYTQLLLALVVCFPNVLIKSWRWVIFWIFLIFSLYISIKFTVLNHYCENDFLVWGFRNSKYILLCLLILPVIYQMIVFWEYSRMYKGYLSQKIYDEYQRYKNSLEGINEGDKDKVDLEYMTVWAEGKIQNKNDEDNSLDNLNRHLFERLLCVASPSQRTLFLSYVRFKIRSLVTYLTNVKKKLSSTQQDEASVSSEKPTETYLSQYQISKPTLDFSKEYKDYIQWRNTVRGPQKGIADYCKSHGVNAKDMTAWVKVYMPTGTNKRNQSKKNKLKR